MYDLTFNFVSILNVFQNDFLADLKEGKANILVLGYR